MTTHHVHTSVGESIKAQATLNARVTANFALQHLKAATIFRDHVITIELNNAVQRSESCVSEVRSYASACIMSSVASLEALINELFIAPNCCLRPMLKDFDSEFWGDKGIEKKNMLDKYQLALKMLDKPPLDKHAQPYRDAWLLSGLRNALVHFKPIWDPEQQRNFELEELLLGKYDVSPFSTEGSDFVTMKSMSASCMRWAVNTTLSFMREFHARTDIDANKMLGFWRLENN
jgi:hypothetical protein